MQEDYILWEPQVTTTPNSPNYWGIDVLSSVIFVGADKLTAWGTLSVLDINADKDCFNIQPAPFEWKTIKFYLADLVRCLKSGMLKSKQCPAKAYFLNSLSV